MRNGSVVVPVDHDDAMHGTASDEVGVVFKKRTLVVELLKIGRLLRRVDRTAGLDDSEHFVSTGHRPFEDIRDQNDICRQILQKWVTSGLHLIRHRYAP